MKEIVKGLISINPNKEDYCDVCNLNQNWETILSDYMSSRYIKCIKFDVHRHYYIAIENADYDTLAVLNTANVIIDSIDYIVNCIKIKFKDESSRDLVFNILNVWE